MLAVLAVHGIPPMPELPEVDMYRRDLEEFFTESAIESIRCLRMDIWVNKPLFPAGPWTGKQLLRHGKILILGFSPSLTTAPQRAVPAWFLLSRFGMSGSWRRLGKSRKNPDHTHLEIRFSRSTDRLLWVDPRRFGRLEWTSDLSRSALLQEIGPDALSISMDDLREILLGSSRTIRSALMDQGLISGIGNIYAAEILFRAGLNPFRTAKALSRIEIGRIHRTLRTVLEEAITAGGSTIHSFARESGSPGGYQRQHLVYGREGRPCVACGTPVQKIVSEGRSLYYCSFCQGSMESTSRRMALVECLMN
jgi:formamidopyrimidine-DNA glycosylase